MITTIQIGPDGDRPGFAVQVAFDDALDGLVETFIAWCEESGYAVTGYAMTSTYILTSATIQVTGLSEDETVHLKLIWS